MTGHDHAAAQPWVLLTVVVLAAVDTCYVRGARRLWRTGDHPRATAVAAGTAVAMATVLPPVAQFAAGRLLGHMVAQMALITVAAPLLAWGAPGRALWAGLPVRLRTLIGRLPVPPTSGTSLAAAVTAWVVHMATVWMWHFPGAHDLAMRVPALRAAEYALFLGTAWWFWWYVLAPSPRRLHPPVAAAYLALATLPSAALGAVLTFSPAPLYAEHAQAGTDALVDQQLAGLIMWIPADLAYFVVALVLFWSWIARGSGPAVLPPGEREAPVVVAPVRGTRTPLVRAPGVPDVEGVRR